MSRNIRPQAAFTLVELMIVVGMLGALAAAFLLVEVIAAPLYARCHDPLSIALIDASTLAFVITIALPVHG